MVAMLPGPPDPESQRRCLPEVLRSRGFVAPPCSPASNLASAPEPLNRLAAFSDSHDGVFERLVFALVVQGSLDPETLTGNVLTGIPSDHAHRVAVVRDGPDAAHDVAALLKAAQAAPGGTELVLVGGGPDRVQALRRLVPWYTGAGIWAAHLGDDGTLSPPRSGNVGKGWLRRFVEARPAGPPDWEVFWTTLNGRIHKTEAETKAFVAGVSGRQPVVTFTLLGVIAVVYCLQLVFNAVDFTPAAIRMGALSLPHVQAGEVWRLVSCTFLHGSLMHVLLNGFVLLSIGVSLEPLLGSVRFLALYTASAIGGSLLSLVFLGEKYSVGASGAIWGLMCAQAAFAWFSKGILPVAMQKPMRSGVGQNLLLNVMNSLRPGVDFGAHAGGGIVGAALVVTGILTVGMPRWALVPAGEEAPEDRVPAPLRMAARLSGLLLAVGLGAALVLGRVWSLATPPPMQRSALGTSSYSANIPAGMVVTVVKNPDFLEFVAGELQSDGAQIYMILAPEAIEADSVAEVKASLIAALTKVDGGTIIQPIQANADGVLAGAHRFESGAILERAVRVGTDGIRRVDVVLWPGVPDAWTGLATRVVSSIEP